MYDLSELDNEEDIEFYSSLNKKCAYWGRNCLTDKIKTSIKKRWKREDGYAEERAFMFQKATKEDIELLK